MTELEFCGLSISKTNLAYLLIKVDSDVIGDHYASILIIKSKAEEAMDRIKGSFILTCFILKERT